MTDGPSTSLTLYHGTNEEIERIDLSRSRMGKDFGMGFYLTPDFHVARRQAERKQAQYGTGLALVHAYRIANADLDRLRVLRFEGYTSEWAKFVLANRQNRSRIQAHDYDVVVGPIADDVIGYQIRRVEEGIIDEDRFLKEIQYHTVTMQYMFATPQATGLLNRI